MHKQMYFLFTIAVISLVIGLYATADTNEESIAVPAFHIVSPGDTYWGIARTYWPNSHTGQKVFELRQLNAALPDMLHPGQKIALREVEH